MGPQLGLITLGGWPSWPDLKQQARHDALGYVLALNLSRRHLDESQRAMIGARIANSTGAGKPSKEIAHISAITGSEAAKMMSVGRRNVVHAKKLLREGMQELADAVYARQLALQPRLRPL